MRDFLNAPVPSVRLRRLTVAISTLATFAGLMLAGCGGGGSNNSTGTSPLPTPTFSPAGGSYTSAQSVTLADTAAGASIYYTTNGSTPSSASTLYTGPISLATSGTTTISAIAETSTNSSSVATASYTITLPQAATPAFSPAAGTYTTAQSVTLSDSTSGATIYYTTDGSTPSTSSTKYTAPVSISTAGTTTLNAIAVASGYTNSAVATAAYTINLTAPSPTFSPAAGTFTTAQTVTISDSLAGATIYYTLDGSTPSTSSTKYTAPISISTAGTTTVNAIAVASGYTNSAVATAAYTINLTAPSPTFSPAGGTFTSAQTVTISDTLSSATIYYTLDGSTPSTSSTKYTAPVSISAAGTTTLNAIAVASGYTNSTVASAQYVLNLTAPAPTFSPAAGTYSSAQSVTLSDTLSSATIYYTLDGSTPTAASTKYTAPISIPATTTVTAIAVATGYTNSAVATALYTINLGTAATPSLSLAAGSYTSAQTVTITDSTPGATIYYTTDGSTPTSSSMVYSGAISLANSETITVSAIATAPSYSASAVASAQYVITGITPSYSYKNVQIVGGGFVDGLYFHPKSQGLMYARTDVGGAYRWNNVPGGDAQWVPLLDFVGRYNNGYQLGVESLGLDPNDPNRLYLATGEYTTSGDNDYIFTSDDMGNTFTAVQLPFANGSNNNGRFAGERLSVDPNNGSHIYFGTRQNGLYESNDHGATWHQVTAFPITGATGTSFDPGVGIIFELFLPNSGTAGNGNTNTVYIGVSDPMENAATSNRTGLANLYVSNDGGVTFSPANTINGIGYYLNSGVFDPSYRYLYLSFARQAASVTAYQNTTPCTNNCTSVGPQGVNDGQIWRFTLPTSGNPSGTWTNITPPLLNGESSSQYVSNPYGFSGVTIDPSDPDYVMVTTLNKYYPPPYDDVFRSLDDGQTWEDLATNASRNDSISPWLNFGQATPDGGNWINHAVVDPFNPNHLMYGDGQTIWETNNVTAADVVVTNATVVTPGNATNWTVGAQGIEETVILGLASPPSGAAHLFSVMFDLGGFTHTSLTQSQLQQMNPELTNGTGVDVAWQAPLNVVRVGDNTQASGSSSATQIVGFSTDGGNTWTPNSALPAGVTQGQGSIAISADGSTVLWMPIDPGVAASYTTDHGATWHASTGAPVQINQGYNRTVVAADRVNPKKFYLFTFQTSTTTNDGIATVYVSTNGGQTFTQAAALSNSYPTGFFVSPAAEGDVWITGYNGLFHSTNSGASFNTVYSFGNPTYTMGFGAPPAGLSYPAIYLIGQLANDSTCTGLSSSDAANWFTTPTNCIYRSTDGGATFLHVNDYAHQYSNPNYIVGDPQVFGRYFLGTPGRGIIEADSTN